MTTTIKTPTAAAIDTAIKNAAKMDAQGYTVEQSESVPHQYFCTKPGTNRKGYYIVNTMPGFESCKCEQFKFEGVCKHQKFVADHIRLLEMEAAFEEEAAWADFASLRDEVEAETPDLLAWPVCEYHGAHESAENGFPISWCEGCERIAL